MRTGTARTITMTLACALWVLLGASCQSQWIDPANIAIADEAYDGPPVTVNLLVQRYVEPVQYIVVVEIMSPTGGWEVELDHAEVGADDSEDERTAMLYITATSPPADAMVTQALVPHHVTFRTDERIDTARVYIRHGERKALAREYRLALRQERIVVPEPVRAVE